MGPARTHREGILPRACTQLFGAMASADAEVTYVVHVSYVECYNGALRDVLATKKRDGVLLREGSSGLQLEGEPLKCRPSGSNSWR